ncbi:MAG: 2-oxo acid dehydrogenase subunit E2, partial [Candidatus Tectomicrobia bacterium]|nr:2-oxo acid dehydrogenase subunit E2 [Candidatus Tectomicrobia bacterium]
MAVSILMPKLGMTMVEGRVIAWFVREGERVTKGQPIARIETEKIEYEVEAPEHGFLGKILIKTDEVAPVSHLIGVIVADMAEVAQLDLAALQASQTRPEREAGRSTIEGRAGETPQMTQREEREERVRATPAARRVARELGVDLSKVTGTGPGGRIIQEDVEKAKEALPSSESEYREVIPMKGIRRAIAENMLKSWQRFPMVTMVVEVDMTEALLFRKNRLPTLDPDGGSLVGPNEMIIKAVALSLVKHPRLASILMENEIKIASRVNIGIAVVLKEEGLLVPVIRDADRKSLGELARESRQLMRKALRGDFTPDELKGGSFTITNLSTFGIDLFTPILNYPETAILGVGRIKEKPAVHQG